MNLGAGNLSAIEQAFEDATGRMIDARGRDHQHNAHSREVNREAISPQKLEPRPEIVPEPQVGLGFFGSLFGHAGTCCGLLSRTRVRK
jgi:hypothetical protein